MIGPLADSVHWDWYGGTPPYAFTPLQGIKEQLGPDVTINYAADELGNAALKRKGVKKWTKHLLEAISILQSAFNYDRLYIGGGNSKHIKATLPGNARVVSNLEGLLGGIMLWRD